MRIGFVGLGNIGGPCARHLVEAGHDVTVGDLEIDVMLDAILDRWTDIEATGSPTNRLSGLKTLPVAFTELPS